VLVGCSLIWSSAATNSAVENHCEGISKTKLYRSKTVVNASTTITMGPLIVAQWFRYCATNLKVAGSIPDGVIGIFH
jgi:hypothetical protein